MRLGAHNFKQKQGENAVKKIIAIFLATLLMLFSALAVGCQYSPEKNPTCSHTYTDTIELAPTCENEGLKKSTCTKCNSKKYANITKINHVFVNGVCSMCDKTETEIEIENTPENVCEHAYSSQVVEQATCQKGGAIKNTCIKCGNEVNSLTAKINHFYVNGKCSMCSANESDSATPCAHAYVSNTVREATCSQEGFVVSTCSKCSSITTSTISKLAHDFDSLGNCKDCDESLPTQTEQTPCEHSYAEQTTVPVSCTQNGLITYTCSKCGDNYEAIIKQLSHVYVDGVCATCSQNESENASPCNHTFITEQVAPSCDNAGYITKTCSKCNSMTTEILAKLLHSYSNGTCINCGIEQDITAPEEPCDHNYVITYEIKPTCLHTGTTRKKCSKCSDQITIAVKTLPHVFLNGVCVSCDREESSLTGTCEHTFGTDILPATCGQTGLITKTCSKCNSITTQVLPKTEHDYQTTTTDATCSKEGSINSVCINCGNSKKQTLPKLSHTFINGICSICNGADDGTSSHEYVSVVLIENSCEQGGVIVNTCSKCGNVMIATQTKPEHSYSNGICVVCGKDDPSSSIEHDSNITISDIRQEIYKYNDKVVSDTDALKVLSQTQIYSVYVRQNKFVFSFDYQGLSLATGITINRSSILLGSGTTERIITLNFIDNTTYYELQAIYAGGTVSSLGYLTAHGSNKYIKSFAINENNEFIIVYSDNSMTKAGTLLTAPQSIANSMLLYTKIEGKEEYAVIGCMDDNITSLVVPKTHNGLPVTEIADEAFFNCSSLQKVEFNENLKRIGTWAFYQCSKIESIKLPKTISYIANSAFFECSKISRVYYRGTEEQKISVFIGSGNEFFSNALWIYNID